MATVEITLKDHVATVTLNRPEAMNSVDPEMRALLHSCWDRLRDDDEIRVVIVTGAGTRAFCTGSDLKKTLPSQNSAAQQQFGNPAGASLIANLRTDKPMIAAINGFAMGGGMELALWCDMRVLEADAYFGVYCRRFGVPLIDGGTVRLPRLIGMGHAMDLILTGRKVEAAEALAMGLANRVVPTGEALPAALALAQQLAAFPQKTMLADRASAHAQWDLPLADALHQEWMRGKHCIAEGMQGAGRFASGAGRHGKS